VTSDDVVAYYLLKSCGKLIVLMWIYYMVSGNPLKRARIPYFMPYHMFHIPIKKIESHEPYLLVILYYMVLTMYFKKNKKKVGWKL
jgi:hypothetical protein